MLDSLLALTLAAGPGPVTLTTITTKLDAPTSVISAPNGTMFVTQKDGRIAKVTKAGKVSTWYRIKVSTDGEQGLLSMARIDSRRFYAAYTDSKGALQVSRFAKGGGQRKIIRIPHPRYSNHNGGQVVLHKGLLYISTGDGGGAGDPFNAARNLQDLRGKILRIDPTCGYGAWCPAASNPPSPSGAIIAAGLRNPWRFSIDPETDQLWIGDVGQNAYEEVDRMRIGGRLRDFGWPCKEADSTYNPDRCGGRKITRPVLRYGHSEGESITGGYVYRGDQIPRLRGQYVFGDFISGHLWAWREGRAPNRIGQADGVTSFGLSADRELLLTTYDGKLQRIGP